MIKCEICGKEFLLLRRHLKEQHNMTVRSYKRLFPAALLVDPEYSKKRKNIALKTKTNFNLKPPAKLGEKRALKYKEENRKWIN